MKRTLLLISALWISVTFFSCKGSREIPSSGSTHPKELLNHLASFEKAVLAHDLNKVLQHMDQDYVDEQCNSFLKGNTAQFINEFFCGELTDGTGFRCLDFKDIQLIERTLMAKKENYWEVSYHVKTRKAAIIANWTISIKQQNSRMVYGLVGAMG